MVQQTALSSGSRGSSLRRAARGPVPCRFDRACAVTARARRWRQVQQRFCPAAVARCRPVLWMLINAEYAELEPNRIRPTCLCPHQVEWMQLVLIVSPTVEIGWEMPASLSIL
eukprot:6064023-Pleurochrysis_carterae.AAC.3